MRLADAIARFENHRQRAYQLNAQDISDYFIFTALAMECFQAVNSLIEVGQLLIARRTLVVPDTYRQVFEVLGQHQIISTEAAEAGKRLVYVRNLIAHEMITEEELLEAIVLLSHMDPLSEVAKQEARG
jgi:uncharacterized protein YutE (UPF0331/DUF86 family)